MLYFTAISENNILILAISRKGKSSRNPASAIGAQSTKKDQERIATRKPLQFRVLLQQR